MYFRQLWIMHRCTTLLAPVIIWGLQVFVCWCECQPNLGQCSLTAVCSWCSKEMIFFPSFLKKADVRFSIKIFLVGEEGGCGGYPRPPSI